MTAPVLPWPTKDFSSCFIFGVILARVLRFLLPAEADEAEEEVLVLALARRPGPRPPRPPFASLRAVMKSSTLALPCFVCNEVRALFFFARAASRAATFD